MPNAAAIGVALDRADGSHVVSVRLLEDGKVKRAIHTLVVGEDSALGMTIRAAIKNRPAALNLPWSHAAHYEVLSLASDDGAKAAAAAMSLIDRVRDHVAGFGSRYERKTRIAYRALDLDTIAEGQLQDEAAARGIDWRVLAQSIVTNAHAADGAAMKVEAEATKAKAALREATSRDAVDIALSQFESAIQDLPV